MNKKFYLEILLIFFLITESLLPAFSTTSLPSHFTLFTNLTVSLFPPCSLTVSFQQHVHSGLLNVSLAGTGGMAPYLKALAVLAERRSWVQFLEPTWLLTTNSDSSSKRSNSLSWNPQAPVMHMVHIPVSKQSVHKTKLK